MEGSEVRRRVVEDHEHLRELLDGIEALSERFQEGTIEIGETLRARGLEFYERFAAHLELEDRILAPALAASGKSGQRKANSLAHEHREQRELLEYLLGRLRDQPIPTILMARELKNFAEYVRLDMVHEESSLLDEEILRGSS